jgi:hypothetical protein
VCGSGDFRQPLPVVREFPITAHMVVTGSPPEPTQPTEAAMQTINLDDKLVFTTEHHTYEGDHPKAGTPQVIISQDHFDGPVLSMFDKNHRGTDLFDTFSVGGWDAGNHHRVEDGGPFVEGPHAFIFKNGFALTAHVQEKREEILVEPGDTVIFRGNPYTIGRGAYGQVALIPAEQMALAG